MRLRPCRICVISFLLCVFFSTAFAETPVIKELFGFPCNAVNGVCPDGSAPSGSLVQASDGNFYGTTLFGTLEKTGGGAIFRITPAGQASLLHEFVPDGNGNFSDGSGTVGGLVEGIDGFLYGITAAGGAHNAGTVFKINKSGSFQLLHSFCSFPLCGDGSNPTPLVLGNDGNLYGGTQAGGAFNNGTIFRITTAGAFTTLHPLNNTTDGGPPSQALIQASDGNFYGVGGFGPSGGLGNLFRVTPKGQFADVHDLNSPPDADANARLIQASNGLLYGTTFYGEVFSLSTTGSFQIVVPGTFDTITGGMTQASDGNLWGTHADLAIRTGDDLFTDATTGFELSHVFFDCQLGEDPQGVIQGADGKLYGVALLCGVDSHGQATNGTVFAVEAGLKPPQAVVAAFAPASGAAGTEVLIRGDHFVGTTVAAFNGVKAAFKVLNTKFISVTVPGGAGTGLITVTNAGGTTASRQSFHVE